MENQGKMTVFHVVFLAQSWFSMVYQENQGKTKVCQIPPLFESFSRDSGEQNLLG